MLSSIALCATLLAGTAFAQTYTDCNPLNSTNCPSDTALGTSATFNFTNYASADSQIWNATSGTVNYQQDGGEFTISQRGDSPTIQSNFYIFFGRVSTVMKAAPGTGIVSSIVLESDDLDEIDWEMIGGNSTYAETNFFGRQRHATALTMRLTFYRQGQHYRLRSCNLVPHLQQPRRS